MKLRPEEITSILKDRIEHYDVETDLAEVGTVLQVGDGIARAYGLENAVALEMLEFEHGVVGLAFNLEEDDVGTALFGEWQHVKEGEPVKRSAVSSTHSAIHWTVAGRSRRPRRDCLSSRLRVSSRGNRSRSRCSPGSRRSTR